ncbi:glycoside hydrolase family 2 protein [Actinophytocola gossypii]|nr:glycoside hydrolase family 2 TIM barrel-domain containing protein [Actinophytocola gossypii]
MSRRRLLHTGAASMLGLAALPVLSAAARGAGGAPVRGAATVTVPLVSNWRFGGRFVNDNATQPGFDDSGYGVVTLPHTVVPLSWRDWNPAAWEHVWIYRKHFDLPPDAAGLRVFLDFDGVLTAGTPWLNGASLGAHRGGYLPFSHEITGRARSSGNVLAVTVDSRWLPVPPSGHPSGAGAVDYFQPGGIYRPVRLRAVPQAFLADVYARPVNVLDPVNRRVEVDCTVDAATPLSGDIVVELRDPDGSVVATRTVPAAMTAPGRTTVHATLTGVDAVRLWDVGEPNLYDVVATLRVDGTAVHDHVARIGFREARFENGGFHLNGRRLTLFGLNRHQIYPYTGMAMPDRVQRHDARILFEEFNCNMVRCAHYPQSTAFLDACDELGMLVFEEVPGWQYVGGAAWQDLVVRDVEQMIRRDRNHPSIVTWGVQVNESAPYRDLYTRTRDLAKRLDPGRQTTGALHGGRYTRTDFVQDVYSYNDYTHTDQVAPLRPPLPGIPFLVSEAVGSLAGPHFYRRTDSQAVQARQAYLHGQVHNQAAADSRTAGLLAWQAFDYDSMNGFTDHRLKCNGVGDTFRVPKLGAAIYQAQVDPRVRPVIAPAFYWDFGPGSPANGPGARAMICANCDRLEVYVGGTHRATVRPDVAGFEYLRYPPSFVDLTVDPAGDPELRIDGYVGGELVLSRLFSANTEGDRLSVVADDDALTADGSDATRVVFRAVDRYGAPRPYVGDEVRLTVSGPGVLVGDNPFPLGQNGGVGAVWVRTRLGQPGTIRLTATHAGLGAGTVTIESA